MLHRITGIMAIIMIFASCSSNQSGSAGLSENETLEVSITDLLSDPLRYDNQTVKIEGMISHVCRHSGDKMRMLQDDSDLSIQVMLGDFTGQFDTESEGMRVSVTGTLVTEVTNMDELEAHSHEDEEHDCEDTRQAVEIMKARGLDADIRTYIALNQYETQ
ncbi:MAG: OB-fold nucleic acid binding domain-containing protein [Bacteroidales bacterium]